jgi:YVTN family beta-propeller protein
MQMLQRFLALFSLSACLLAVLLIGADMPSALAQVEEPTPRPLYALPDARSNPVFTSNTIASSELLGVLVVANTLGDSVSVVAPNAGELLTQIPVEADPRTVAITSDGVKALITNRGTSSLTVIDLSLGEVEKVIPLGGTWPYGVVTRTNDIAYVTMQGSNEVLIVDIVSGEVLDRIPTPSTPTGIALWGDFLYITHLWSGDLSLVYLPQGQVASTISTGLYTSMSPSIDIDITRGIAYLPQSRSNAVDPNLTYDTIVFPVVNVVQLGGLGLERLERITPDTAARPANMPFAVQIDPFRQWVYVANAGSNDLTVIDIETGRALANIEVGANPRGLLLNGDNSQIYVHNVVDGTLAIVDTTSREIIDTIPVNPDISIPVDILIGAELFYSSEDPRLAESHWVSCANCHFDGMSDGRVWQDFDDGPRNTPHLFDLGDTFPYNWSGSWDELQDVELKIRGLQAGTGLLEDTTPNDPLGDPHAGLSLDLDTLVIYLDTLQGPTSPFVADAAVVERGEEVFVEQGCGECHTLPLGTNHMAYDVGTGGMFDTPTVRWLWLTDPYFHDGSAETLQDVFTMSGTHQLSMRVQASDIDALVTYLLTLPSDETLAD